MMWLTATCGALSGPNVRLVHPSWGLLQSIFEPKTNVDDWPLQRCLWGESASWTDAAGSRGVTRRKTFGEFDSRGAGCRRGMLGGRRVMSRWVGIVVDSGIAVRRGGVGDDPLPEILAEPTIIGFIGLSPHPICKHTGGRASELSWPAQGTTRKDRPNDNYQTEDRADCRPSRGRTRRGWHCFNRPGGAKWARPCRT